MAKPSKIKIGALVAAGAAMLAPAVGLAATAGTAGAASMAPYLNAPTAASAAFGVNVTGINQFSACTYGTPSDGYVFGTQSSADGSSLSAVYSPSTGCWSVNGLVGPAGPVYGNLYLDANTKAGVMHAQVNSQQNPIGQQVVKTNWIANLGGTIGNGTGQIHFVVYYDYGVGGQMQKDVFGFQG